MKDNFLPKVPGDKLPDEGYDVEIQFYRYPEDYDDGIDRSGPVPTLNGLPIHRNGLGNSMNGRRREIEALESDPAHGFIYDTERGIARCFSHRGHDQGFLLENPDEMQELRESAEKRVEDEFPDIGENSPIGVYRLFVAYEQEEPEVESAILSSGLPEPLRGWYCEPIDYLTNDAYSPDNL